MNKYDKHIETLLQLFMQGESTLEQERELSDYFASSESIPEQWEPYREMMAYFDAGMPIEAPAKPRGKISRSLWALVAAAAVAAIVVMVVPHLGNDSSTKKTDPIVAKLDSVIIPQVIDSPLVTYPEPIIAKAKKKKIKETVTEPLKPQVTPTRKATGSSKPAVESKDIEREQGEMEQAQQELMADKYIIEQEREEVINEQYTTRAQLYRVQQTISNENPQLIQVVFK